MAKQKLTFRSVPASEITRRYQKTQLLFLALHGLAILAAAGFVAAAAMGWMTWPNALFCAVTAGVLNWLIASFAKVKRASFSAILNTDCDPVKLEKVFAPLDKRPERFDDITLNMVRALFYQGRWQEALKRLQKAKKPRENTPLYFQYYNLLASCYEQARDLEKLLAIQRKIQNSVSKLKPRSPHIGNGRQLLSILDIMLTQQEGQITRCKEACREMYDQASFALSRINISLRLAQLEHLTGANHSAVTRCEYIIDDGGTTFYAQEAKKLYRLCCGKDYLPEGEHRPLPDSLEEWEDEYGDEDQDGLIEDTLDEHQQEDKAAPEDGGLSERN